MEDTGVGRVIRALRLRRGWRQRDLSDQAGVRQQEVSDAERGRVAKMRLERVRAIAAPLDLTVALLPRWRGGELDRLVDRDHAALAAEFAHLLGRLGWLVAPEASYSHYGERGSIDLLAFHPQSGILLVVEIKTVIADMQALLRGIDVKVRRARDPARERGWEATVVVPMLVLLEGRTNRRRLAEHEALLGRFGIRGRAALAWLRQPVRPGSGLLLHRSLPSGGRRAGRQRMRPRCGSPDAAESSFTGGDGTRHELSRPDS